MVLPEPYGPGDNWRTLSAQRPWGSALVETISASIKANLQSSGDPALSAPPPIPPPYLDHHLDDRMTFKLNTDGELTIDQASSGLRYFVPGTKSWDCRPGPLPPQESWDQGYKVRLKSLVIVGHFAQTFTSINTMEAANESGRHGVNAILNDYEQQFGANEIERFVHIERCMIWPLDADEPTELDFLKEVDRAMFWDEKEHRPKRPNPKDPEQFAPHLFEILRLDDWSALTLPSPGTVKNNEFHNAKLWDSDGWKRFEKSFGGLWGKLLTLGRFSTPFS